MDEEFATSNSGADLPRPIVTGELIGPGPPNKAIDTATAPQEDADWAERSACWQRQNIWKPRRADQKRKVRSPLVLGGHGVRLRIDRGSLFVQNGFTHYPQQREEWRFFPGRPDLPSRIVVVDADGSITFDVLAWLSTQRIPIVQINWRGEATVLGGASYVADSELVQAQLAAQASKRRTMAISRWLVTEKIAASCNTLTQTMAASPAREQALQELAASAHEMKVRPPQTIDALRGIEGRVAQAYFSGWRSMPLQWKGLAPKADPGRMASDRPADAAEQQAQSERHPSGQCHAELRIRRARKPDSDCRCCGRARSDDRLHACPTCRAIGVGARPDGADASGG